MKISSLELFAFLLVGFSTACSGPKSPSFEKLDNLKVVKASKNYIVLKGDAIYHNPNSVKGMLTKTDMKILVNDVEVSQIDQTSAVAVPKQSDFAVPVTIQFAPKKIQNENKGFLKNAVKSFLDKKLEVTYVGSVSIQVLNVEFDVPVDYSKKVSFGLNYSETD